MAKLPRYSLVHNDKSKKWELKHEGSGQVVKRFGTKASATKGVLDRAVKGMGSVRIRKRNGCALPEWKQQQSNPLRERCRQQRRRLPSLTPAGRPTSQGKAVR